MNKHPQLPVFAAFLSLISLQTGAAFAKTVFPLVGPEGIAALRIGIAAILLCTLFPPWKTRIDRRVLPGLMLYGVMIGGMSLLIYKAFSYIPVGIAISIEVIGPLGVAILGSRRKSDFIWIAFALAGLVLLPLGKQGGSLDPRGLAYVLAAALFWGIYVKTGAKIAVLGRQGVTAGMVIAALCVVPFGITHAGMQLFKPAILLTGLVIAVMSSALPFLLDIYALKRLPERVFGVLMSASPAVSAVAGWLILAEKLSVAQCMGIAFITIACFGVTLFAAKHQR